MKQPLAQLLLKAASFPVPKRMPPKEPLKLSPYLKPFKRMAKAGHKSSSMADFLAFENEIPADRKACASNAIRNLLAKASA